MIGRVLTLALAVVGLSIAISARAGTPYERELTCPVGGQEFTHTSTGSYSTYGARPDGRPYGSWYFPIPIPECPDNGLVLYREFEEDEIGALTALVLSDDYRALREETAYYRAQWLYDRLDDGTTTPPWLLMRAGWEVDDQPARKARYQREFAERAARFPIESEDIESLFLRFRVANAWRELGEFERALTALDTIPTAALDVEIPDRSEAEYEAIEEAESRRYLLATLAPMHALIAERNVESEPLTLIPEREAIYRCADLLVQDGEAAEPFCSAPQRADDIAEAREQLRQVREAYDKD